MFNKILNTFGTKIAAALINLLIAVVISQTLGDMGKGTQSLLLTTITFILIFSEIVCGASIIYLAPRHDFSKLFVPSAIWSTLIAALMGCGILLFYPKIESSLIIHVAVLSLISCLSAFNSRILIGKEEIKKANYNTLLQPVLIIITILTYYVVLKKDDIFGYILALYIAYGSTFLWGIWMLRDEYRSLRFFSIGEYNDTLKDLFKYGFLNQTGHFVQFFNLRLSYYLLYAYMDEGRVGVFSNSVSLAEALWIISNSIAMVQYARISNTNDKAYAQKLTLDLGKICLLISAIAILVLALLPTTVYTFIFGCDFGEMAGIIRILAPGVLLYSIFLILGHYYSGTGRYHLNTLASLCGLVSTCVFGFTLIPRMDVTGAAITSTLSYSINALFLFCFFMKESHFKAKDFILSKAEIKQYCIEIKKQFFK